MVATFPGRSPISATSASPVYLPFGEISQTNSAGTDTVTKKFTGQEYDEESGLYYYNARYYDPAIGRFLSPDAVIQNIWDAQTYQPYAYVRNNPVKYVDPSGNDFGLVLLVGGAIIFSPVLVPALIVGGASSAVAIGLAYGTAAIIGDQESMDEIEDGITGLPGEAQKGFDNTVNYWDNKLYGAEYQFDRATDQWNGFVDEMKDKLSGPHGGGGPGTPAPVSAGTTVWPVVGHSYVNDGYHGVGEGCYINAHSTVGVGHPGMDLEAPMGAVVVAPRAGTVVQTWDSKTGGGMILLRMDGGGDLLFMHLSRTVTAQGTRVVPGQEIGTINNSGSSNGPHLHMEYHPGGYVYGKKTWADPWQIIQMGGVQWARPRS